MKNRIQGVKRSKGQVKNPRIKTLEPMNPKTLEPFKNWEVKRCTNNFMA